MNVDGYVLIVGGGSGIGEACALAFAREGAAGIMVADINLFAAETVAAECRSLSQKAGFRADAIHIDVTIADSVSSVTTRMAEEYGRIDYCVNNAGIGVECAKEISEADAEEFVRFQNVNVLGTFHVTRSVSAVMKMQDPKPVYASSPGRGTTRGAIVIMGSLASFVPQPSMVQYTASKHAVLGICRNAALDNAPHGIRVNSVCPSWVDTPMVQKAVSQVPGLDDMIKRIVPVGRVALPEEVADTVVFLCSPRSSYMTGCSMVVDGGTALRGIV